MFYIVLVNISSYVTNIIQRSPKCLGDLYTEIAYITKECLIKVPSNMCNVDKYYRHT